MSTTIIIETDAQDTTVIAFPDIVPTTVEVQTQYAQNFARPKKVVDEDQDAVSGDEFKWIDIDASLADVTYNIDPGLFTGLTLHIRVKDATFAPTVSADSGTIKLINGDDQTSVQLINRQAIKLYSDGTNLEEVA